MQKPVPSPKPFKKTAIGAAFALGVGAGVFLSGQFNGAADCPVPAGSAQEVKIGDVLRGPVPASKIHDADTIHLSRDGKNYSIRIWGIDAPETRQICADANNDIVACGRQAREVMIGIIGTGTLSCEVKSLDKLYNRLVGLCTTGDGTDIGRELVKRGYAYNEVHNLSYYKAERDYAESRRLGLWAGREFMDPKEWRDACTSRGHKGPRPGFCSVLNKKR
jgi:endonuclease YncB( thermonuclease family)